MADETRSVAHGARGVKKRTYAPPRILSRERLEAIAGTCSGVGKENRVRCPAGPIAS